MAIANQLLLGDFLRLHSQKLYVHGPYPLLFVRSCVYTHQKQSSTLSLKVNGDHITHCAARVEKQNSFVFQVGSTGAAAQEL